MSARGALYIFRISDQPLIGEGRLLERDAYFKILKSRNSEFSYAFSIFEKYMKIYK